jgi:D-cysteine desulfhydrase
MQIHYPPSIRMAQLPTPLQEMKRLSAYYGGPRIFFKRDDLTGFELSGNKIRKLEFLLADARRKKATVLVTCGGIQSNHCRATAAAGARLGFKVHLLLRGRIPRHPYDGNLLLDHLFGAEITFCTRREYAQHRDALIADIMKHYTRRRERPYYFPVGASVPIGCWGYIRAFEETHAQLREMKVRATHFVNAVGSGGTTAGLLLGRELVRQRAIQLLSINVCDDAEYFYREIRALIAETKQQFKLDVPDPAAISFEVLDGYIGDGYAIPYDAEIREIRRVAELEGVLLDAVYTGKAFYGMVDQIRRGRLGKKDTVVFFHTGGAFALFAQKDYYDSAHKR